MSRESFRMGKKGGKKKRGERGRGGGEERSIGPLLLRDTYLVPQKRYLQKGGEKGEGKRKRGGKTRRSGPVMLRLTPP